MRDIWLDDDEPGCLECGALVFKASLVPGVCASCLSEASSSRSSFGSDFGYDSDYKTSGKHGENVPWETT